MGGITNSSFLALIPKEVNTSSFSRFRPISLCNVSYKIISKVNSNRIKPLLPKLISPNQGGFVEKRKIIDNIILVQEAIHSSKTRKQKGMIIKLDMANAFDRVNHRFLLVSLKFVVFDDHFLNWVLSCFSSPWISPLINGRPTLFFHASRGICQGCPLSPLLYILMVEALSRSLEHARREKSIP
jgi:hypothetical protein